MNETYRVLIVGMGKRGMHHGTHFKANPRFEVTGICDIDPSRLNAAADQLGGPSTGNDAAAMARELRPDVFCFCTLPALRLPILQVGVDSGAKLIAFEKPVALTSAEASRMRQALAESGVKAVVSHQHRYGAHYQKVAGIVAGGSLGRIHTVYGTATGWFTHMMSHLIDYTREYIGGSAAEWVMAQAAGRSKLSDNHPSPDYVSAVVQYANGVRGYYETGAGAPDQPEVAKWWGKCRIGAQGTDGFAEVLTNGGWRAVTRSGAWSGDGAMNYDLDMPGYIQEMADWLDDDSRVHACNFDSAYQGCEIMAGMLRSAAGGGQVALPLRTFDDEQALIRAALSDRPVQVSSPANAAEFGMA